MNNFGIYALLLNKKCLGAMQQHLSIKKFNDFS